MASSTNANQGFANMDEGKQRDTARKGGKATDGKNLDTVDRSRAGKKGAQSETREAKAEGGRHSHGNGQ